MLEAFGVAKADEGIYRLLLRHSSLTRDELAARAGVDAAELDPALARLEEIGLVNPLPGLPVRFAAARPDAAVEMLATRWQERVTSARATARALLAELPVDARHRPEDQVEILFGRDSVAARFDRLQRAAWHEVLVLDRPPYAQEPAEPNQAELEMLARGVRVRGLYAPEALEVPGAFETFAQTIAAGEEARVHVGIPLKLAIADGTTAILPFSSDEREMVDSAFVIHAGNLLDALVRLFELLWASAIPIPGQNLPVEKDLDRQLITLMAAGLKDDAAARQLGISVRTLNRRVSELMQRLGARTRFQAGLQAARDLDQAP
ncbi:helix-turn-helix domain-containing protein [Actinomadura oligospora]|uniref:helix-turn-helix domain-containing protein n=1 Tax=Actinomadura oligospora TaxID=111804 RepID=UPI00047E1B1D|nr:helix-turn-helix domain-containing protein [Actinomadura oligospora]